MKRLTSRVLYKASPVMLAVALGMLGPAALNDDEEDAQTEVMPDSQHADAPAVEMPESDAKG